MKTLAIALTACMLMLGSAADAATFHPISGITSDTVGTDFFPAIRAIQGPGVGFDAAEPHNRTSSLTWVTNAPNGGSGDYFAPHPTPGPRLVLDLGSDVWLGEISVWGYANGNANGVRFFDLQFAKEADGLGGFGTSIPFNPTYNTFQNVTPRQSFDFGQVFTARYVEFTPTDNFFGINPPGGDRIGLGEIAFAVPVVPEPTTVLIWSLLAGLGIGLGWRRKR